MVLWLDHIWSVAWPDDFERPAIVTYWLVAGGCLVVGFVLGWVLRYRTMLPPEPGTFKGVQGRPGAVEWPPRT